MQNKKPTFKRRPKVYIKKYDIFNKPGAPEIDYKDIDLLKGFISEAGKIIPSRVTGTGVYNQSKVAQAVKRARFLALIEYTDKH